MKALLNMIYGAAALSVAFTAFTACSDWTEPEAEDFFKTPTEAYNQNLKDYYASPHKIMWGWFGNWGASSKSNSLMGLPDSVDIVGLWLTTGQLTEAQTADLKAFHERGSKTVMSWTPGNIGQCYTPEGADAAEFWGYTEGDEDSYVQAAIKYANAVADTIVKYDLGGFDLDLEWQGTLISGSHPQRLNEFIRTLHKRMQEYGGIVCVDIPGGSGWLNPYYTMLDDDVLEMIYLIMWQTYELNHAGLDNFFNAVKSRKPEMFETVMRKSVVTATFERSADKYLFDVHSTWHYYGGIEHAGMGAYHIEYDYAGSPDYPCVRKAIATQNPPIRE